MANLLLPALLVAALSLAAPRTLARDIFIEPDAPLVARVFDDTIRIRNPAEARQAIVAPLLDRYATRKGIVAEPAEVEAYAGQLRRNLQADRLRWASRREEIDRRLGERTLAAAERKLLLAEREVLRSLLREDAAPIPNAVALEETYFIRPLAAGVVKQWKVDRALHQQYGGRVAVQAGVPEPVDAYRRFLEESLDRGDFQLLAPELEHEFWKYYRTDALHAFLPAGSREEARAFAVAPWQPETARGSR